MTENPYQSPTIVDSRGVLGDVRPTPRVDGKWLIIRSDDELPRFCVKTNEAVSVLDMRTKEFTWCSPLVALLILVSGPLLIIVYYLLRKRCYLTFGLSERLQRRYRRIFIAKVVAACGLFMAVPMIGATGDQLSIVVLLLFLAAVASLFFGNSPLALSKHRDKEFWVAGCCKDFLDRIRLQSTAPATALLT